MVPNGWCQQHAQQACDDWTDTKAELPLEGIFFRTQFPSLGIFIDKVHMMEGELIAIFFISETKRDFD